MSITTENTFESALVQSLIEQGGYTEGNAPDVFRVYPQHRPVH